jgi:hypothetical protein
VTTRASVAAIPVDLHVEPETCPPGSTATMNGELELIGAAVSTKTVYFCPYTGRERC